MSSRRPASLSTDPPTFPSPLTTHHSPLTQRTFLSVLVVNYNGSRYLPACLAALRGQSYPRDRFEVVVVDNASTEGGLDGLAARFPWVRWVRLGRNHGFAGGNNRGFAHCRGDCVVLLNND